MQFSIKSFASKPIVRWWIVGIFFMGFNIPVLYLTVDILKMPLFLATAVASEIGTMFRYLVNDRWVFGHPKPTWKRFWQYHAAVFSSFVIWWVATNGFARLGVHYILASVLATGCSVFWSMATNFLWIWGHKKPAPQSAAASPDPLTDPSEE